MIFCDTPYYVEGIKYNLLSVSQLNSLGCKVEFGNTKAKIYDANGKLIGSGDQTGVNLFYLDMNEATFLVIQNDDLWVWNERLCHVNLDNFLHISLMSTVKGLEKLKKLDNVICKQYQLGKMTKSSFKSKIDTSNAILELVHTNLCELIDVKS